MNTGICPILSRFVTDLYVTIPEDYSEKIRAKEDANLWDVKIDPVYIDRRMFQCVDYAFRYIVPLVFDKEEQLKDIAVLMRTKNAIITGKDLNEVHELVEVIYEKIDVILDKESLSGDVEDYLNWAQDVMWSIRWIIEAAICGSAVVGPLTVNLIDVMSETFGWDVMFPHAKVLMDKLREVELYVN